MEFGFNYVNGKREGNCIEFYENGRKKSDKIYKNDVDVGPDIEYYHDGSVKSETRFGNFSESDSNVIEYRLFHELTGKLIQFNTRLQNTSSLLTCINYDSNGNYIDSF